MNSTFWSRLNFVPFHLIPEQNLSLCMNIAVTQFGPGLSGQRTSKFLILSFTLDGTNEKVNKCTLSVTRSSNLSFFTITKYFRNFVIKKNWHHCLIFLYYFDFVYLFRAALFRLYLELCKVCYSIGSTTLSIMTFSMMTFSMMNSAWWHSAWWHSAWWHSA